MIETNELIARLQSLLGWRPVLDALAGYANVFVVGGAVRDLLLNRSPKELDFVVIGDAISLARSVVQRIDAKVVAYEPKVVAHERFGTATIEANGIPKFDLASARSESYELPGSLPTVELGASIETDLKRRDFTVNAIAMRISDGLIVSVDSALEDLAARRLRVLHQRSFLDDPTRILRMARYVARLGFSIEPNTERLAREALEGGSLQTVSGNRIGAEVVLAIDEPQPDIASQLKTLGIAEIVFSPQFVADVELIRNVLKIVPEDGNSQQAAFATCLINISDVKLMQSLDRLGFNAPLRDGLLQAAARAKMLCEEVSTLVANSLHSTEGECFRSRLWSLLRVESIESISIAGALCLQNGDTEGFDAFDLWIKDLRNIKLEITGDDIVTHGISGTDVGVALKAAMVAKLDKRAHSYEEQLAAALKSVGEG